MEAKRKRRATKWHGALGDLQLEVEESGPELVRDGVDMKPTLILGPGSCVLESESDLGSLSRVGSHDVPECHSWQESIDDVCHLHLLVRHGFVVIEDHEGDFVAQIVLAKKDLHGISSSWFRFARLIVYHASFNLSSSCGRIFLYNTRVCSSLLIQIPIFPR